MNNEEIINKYYKEAVKGLSEEILRDHNLWYLSIINLSKDLKVVYTIIILHQQVLNGGFHQYFFNSYGQFAYMTLEHLKLIKANKSAKILQSAVNLINDEGLTIDDFREKICQRKLLRLVNFDDELCDMLEKLDDEYYEVEEDIEQLVVDYLNKNSQDMFHLN